MGLAEIAIVAGCTTALAIVVWRTLLSPKRRWGGPLHPLSLLKRGRVYTQGLVVAHQTLLTAPLSKKKGVAFRAVVERKDLSNHWSTLVQHSSAVDFDLNDGHGTSVGVQVEHHHLVLEHEVELSLGQGKKCGPLPDRVFDLMVVHGHVTPRQEELPRLRWSEWVVEPGQEVFVVGQVRQELITDPQKAGQRLYRAAPTRKALTGTPDYPVFVMDHPKPEE